MPRVWSTQMVSRYPAASWHTFQSRSQEAGSQSYCASGLCAKWAIHFKAPDLHFLEWEIKILSVLYTPGACTANGIKYLL